MAKGPARIQVNSRMRTPSSGRVGPRRGVGSDFGWGRAWLADLGEDGGGVLAEAGRPGYFARLGPVSLVGRLQSREVQGSGKAEAGAAGDLDLAEESDGARLLARGDLGRRGKVGRDHASAFHKVEDGFAFPIGEPAGDLIEDGGEVGEAGLDGGEARVGGELGALHERGQALELLLPVEGEEDHAVLAREEDLVGRARAVAR